MTRAKRGIGLIACVVTMSLAAACTALVASSERPPAAIVNAETATCVNCTCDGECTPETAWMCPSGACNANGSCACDPAYAATDCPSTGCCDTVLEPGGEPLRDRSGAPIYQCVSSSCTSDGDCSDGQLCSAGSTCGQNACVCPDGEGADPDEPCCRTVNVMGTCCESGLVDASGLCVCSGPLIEDRGAGCQCPDDMVADEQGACVCQDPHAGFDADVGRCVCVAGYRADFDPYSGETACVADDDGPVPCPDPHAVIDPDTLECECEPGFVLGDALDMTTAQCVPTSCGDGVCEASETCDLCSYDCGSCDGDPPPDAGVPDAPAADAGAPDAPPRDAGVPDVAPHDAGGSDVAPRDASPCNAGSGRAICHVEDGGLLR